MALYGLGSMSNGIKNRGLSAFLLLFYSQVMSLPATWVGAVIMVVMMIDGAVDPIVGLASDNLRTSWGRRHPFMYAAALPYGLMFCLVWNPPGGLSDQVLAVYLAVCIVAVRLFDTFFEVPASALAPELTEDYDRRTTLISFRYFFTFLGGLLLSLVAYQVFLREGPSNPDGLLSRTGYGQYGLAAGVTIFVVILISAWGTHHFIPWLQPAVSPRLTPAGLAKQVASTLANRSLWVAAASGMFMATAAGFASGLSMYFNIYFWELTAAQLSLMVGAGFVASLAGVLLGPRVLAFFGKKHGAMLLFGAALVVTVSPIALRLLGLLPANGSPIVVGLLVAEGFLLGAINLMLNIAITSMIADLAEDVEVRTGRRSEGLLVSADNFLKKSTAGIGVFVSSVVLAVAGFPEKARPGEVPLEALERLGLVFLPAVSLFYLGAILCLLGYRIDRRVHAANLALLKARAEDTGRAQGS